MHKKALIYLNLLNQVPMWLIMQHYQMSELEVMGVFAFVTAKIKSYLHERLIPPIPCDTLREAEINAILLRPLLNKLNFDKDPKFSKIKYEGLNQDNIESGLRSIKR